MMKTDYTIMAAVVLSLALISNLILVLCLIHTWKHWRQIKWYIILLTVANWIEIFFTWAPQLAVLRSQGDPYFLDSNALCKFAMAMNITGPCLGAMAVAAASVHVLITACSGCQGNRLRHSMVIGLFVMLSLTFPVCRLFITRLRTLPDHGRSVCFTDTTVNTLGTNISLTLFPGFVVLCCLLPATVFILMKRKGDQSGDGSISDAVISVLLGLILLVTHLPFAAYHLNVEFGNGIYASDTIIAVSYLLGFSGVLSAVVIVIFAYVNWFRRRDTASTVASTPMGERQKLVN